MRRLGISWSIRWARARMVRLCVLSSRHRLAESSITIVNDGVTATSPPELRGLAALRQRLAGDGGELTMYDENRRDVKLGDVAPG
ncbi:hypothetical protein [Micromonospora profundi]|uniref:hypothetical protein n=1 Tax=Micromonospora profundi TaxID=1420889 RepID=UPI00364F3790